MSKWLKNLKRRTNMRTINDDSISTNSRINKNERKAKKKEKSRIIKSMKRFLGRKLYSTEINGIKIQMGL